MDFLGPFHPQITHAPIVLIIVGLLFDLVGRALDREWWRKAGFAMLALGALAAVLAVLSGTAAGEVAEKRGVPEASVDAHEEMARIAMWLGIAATVLVALAGRAGRLKGLVTAAGLLVWLGAAVAVGVAAHRGGQLVFRHGAGVQALPHAPAPGSGHEVPDKDHD